MDQMIVDASVGAKWFLKEEELKEEADFLMDRVGRKNAEIIVPEFFYSEMANIFWKQVRKTRFNIQEAQYAMDQLAQLPFRRYSDQELSDVAMDNAIQFGISVYDALYFSLAEIYVAPLVTADKALFKACRKRFDFIEYLGDLKKK